MKRVHLFIDWLDNRFGIKTNQVEKCLRLLFETVLLVMCSVPSVHNSRDAVVQIVVGAMRLHQVEGGRAKTSILGRAAEQGKISPRPKLAPEKELLLEQIEWHDLVCQWIWPVVTPIAVAVASGDPNAISGALLLGVAATLLRGLYDKPGMTWWRADRVEWKKVRDDVRAAMDKAADDAYWAQWRGKWFGDIDKMNIGKKRGEK